jgi:hypothetical protein
MKTMKKSFVTASCYSEEFGLVCLSLIDSEVVVYYIK